MSAKPKKIILIFIPPDLGKVQNLFFSFYVRKVVSGRMMLLCEDVDASSGGPVIE